MIEMVFEDVAAWRIDTRDYDTAAGFIRSKYGSGFRVLIKCEEHIFLCFGMPAEAGAYDAFNCDDSLSMLLNCLEHLRDWSADPL
jgi:hypothetical protein